VHYTVPRLSCARSPKGHHRVVESEEVAVFSDELKVVVGYDHSEETSACDCEGEEDESEERGRGQDVSERQVQSLEQRPQAFRSLNHPEQSADSDDSEGCHVEVELLDQVVVGCDHRHYYDHEVELVPVHMPVVGEPVRDYFQQHLKSEDHHESFVCVVQDFAQFLRFAGVVDAQKDCVDDNCNHNQVLEGLRLDDFETL